jgi:hypothetical protein
VHRVELGRNCRADLRRTAEIESGEDGIRGHEGVGRKFFVDAF